jgi:hypothetical protein
LSLRLKKKLCDDFTGISVLLDFPITESIESSSVYGNFFDLQVRCDYRSNSLPKWISRVELGIGKYCEEIASSEVDGGGRMDGHPLHVDGRVLNFCPNQTQASK